MDKLLKKYYHKLIGEYDLDVRLLVDDEELIEFLVSKVVYYQEKGEQLESEVDRLEGTIEDLRYEVEDLRDKLDTNLY